MFRVLKIQNRKVILELRKNKMLKSKLLISNMFGFTLSELFHLNYSNQQVFLKVQILLKVSPIYPRNCKSRVRYLDLFCMKIKSILLKVSKLMRELEVYKYPSHAFLKSIKHNKAWTSYSCSRSNSLAN